MDDNNEFKSSEYRDNAEPEADLPASTIIGANITGANAGTYVGGVVGPASEAEAEETEEAKEARGAREDEQEDLGAINFDALGKFTSNQDQSASTGQSGSGANEPNG